MCELEAMISRMSKGIALGSDGFYFGFLQYIWDIVNQNLIAFVVEMSYLLSLNARMKKQELDLTFIEMFYFYDNKFIPV